MTPPHTRRTFLAMAAAVAASGGGLTACGEGKRRTTTSTGVLRARMAIGDPHRQAWEDVRRTAERMRLVALHAPFTQADRAAELKAANPDCLTFAYQDFGFAGYEGQRATGLYRPECEANGWLARDEAGNLMENEGFPGSWLVDSGKPGYAERWAEAVLQRLEEHGGRKTWDGVLLDDVNAYVALTEPHWPAGYSSHDDHYARAIKPAIAKIDPLLHGRGYQMWANLGGWGDFPVLDGLIGHLDVCMEEFFGAGAKRAPQNASRIANSARSAALCARVGKIYLGVAQLAGDDDEATARYADLLMRIIGRPGRVALAAHSTYDGEPWFESFDEDLGRPLAPKRVSGSIYSRRFARATAFANTGGEPAALPDGSQLGPLNGQSSG